MEKLLDVFFGRKYENEINRKLLEIDYVFPKDDILEYVKSLISIDVDDFLRWIDVHTFFTIDSTDMPQLSDFEDAYYNVVFSIINVGDPGLRYVEIGKLLQQDNVERNDIANRKYGENHAKASEYLGYLFSLKYHYYASCIGYVLEDLSDVEKEKLYSRLLIRTNLFKSIYLLSKNGNINLRSLFDILADKTYKRRISSTKLVLNRLSSSTEYDFNKILDNIEY